MKTLFNSEQFVYKGLEIVANDFLITKEISTRSGRTSREWTVSGKKGHVIKVDNVQELY